MDARRLLKNLVAARNRPHRPGLTVQFQQLQLPLPLLERRVIAARLGGGARPVPASRALFDDVQ